MEQRGKVMGRRVDFRMVGEGSDGEVVTVRALVISDGGTPPDSTAKGSCSGFMQTSRGDMGAPLEGKRRPLGRRVPLMTGPQSLSVSGAAGGLHGVLGCEEQQCEW